MHPLERRINSLLCEQGPAEPRIIDITDQTQRAWALRNCRGPNPGWTDYLAGRDYVPPKYFESDVPLGPNDDRGNPYSAKYGGVRPWSDEEIIRTIIHREDEGPGQGLLWIIARKPDIQRAFRATYGTWDDNMLWEAIQLGAAAAWRALQQDQGRLGVRFTSFLGNWIPEGMKTGVPPGFFNEYRESRGLLSRLEQHARRCLRAISASQPVDAHLEALRAEVAGLDPIPHPRNRSEILTAGGRRKQVSFGLLAGRLSDVATRLIDAATEGSASRLQQALEFLTTTREKIEEEEDLYTVRGPKTGGPVITKPKDQPTLPVAPLMTAGSEGGRERERAGIRSRTDSSSLRTPERVELLTAAVNLLRSGTGEGRSWAAERALKVISSLETILDTPATERHYQMFLRDGIYRIRDASGKELSDSFESEPEARARVTELNRDQRLRSLTAIEHDLTGEFGEFKDELRAVIQSLRQALLAGDVESLRAVRDELNVLTEVAEEHRLAGERRSHLDAATPQEYRVLLRLFGISQYPERGTVDDPEVDATGNLSLWAQSGYPATVDTETIRADLWAGGRPITAARVADIKKSALAKMTEALRVLQQRGLSEGCQTCDAIVVLELRSDVSGLLLREIGISPLLLG